MLLLRSRMQASLSGSQKIGVCCKKAALLHLGLSGILTLCLRCALPEGSKFATYGLDRRNP